MTDCFALLGEPRRPGLDIESLKARFHSLAAESHPDRFHNAGEAERLAATERHSALNSAFAILRDPKERLGHLLELELSGKLRSIDSVPADLMDLFMDLGNLCRAVDQFLSSREAVTSPLLKVRQFQQGMVWTERLTTANQPLLATIEEIRRNTAEWNSLWDSAPAIGSAERAAALPLAALEDAFRRISFLTRWQAQLRERIARLAM